MNRSTFCEIKYMNRLFFSKVGYMIRVGFKILAKIAAAFHLRGFIIIVNCLWGFTMSVCAWFG